MDYIRTNYKYGKYQVIKIWEKNNCLYGLVSFVISNKRNGRTLGMSIRKAEKVDFLFQFIVAHLFDLAQVEKNSVELAPILKIRTLVITKKYL